MSNNREELSKEELELHQIMLSRTKLKSSMRTSTLMAGFALVRPERVVSITIKVRGIVPLLPLSQENVVRCSKQ